MTSSIEIRHLRWIMLGAVIGVGNFFSIPDELAKIGGIAFLFWNLISLVFLCAPLICAELMWGKWLRRSLYESFGVVHPKAKNLSVIMLLTLGLAFPPYIYSFSVFFVKATFFLANYWGVASNYLQSEDFIYLPYFGSLFFAVLSIASLRLRREWFSRLIQYLLIFAFVSIGVVAAEVIHQWGVSSHILLFKKGFLEMRLTDIFRVANLSFFSVSVCCSIFFSLIQWLPKKRVEEGGLIRLSFFLVGGDFVASLMCYLVVAPFVRSGLNIGPLDMYLDLIPHSLLYLSGGYFIILLMFAALLALGFCTISVVFWVCADHLELGLNHTRSKTLLRLSWWSVVALFLPIIPKLRTEMFDWALHFLMPLSALIIALSVLVKMPFKSQRLMLGRGFYLDGMVKFWRFSMYYIVLPYLVFTIIWFLR